ncbi:MAG: VWA domain-containing protein [Clostridia bacterium]|nr:VWA domain-containing protein [Clostridia bacterium]
MKNISFDKPYLLLVAIPLLLLILIPFFISIRRDNRSKSVIVSLILHILIVALVVPALAVPLVTTVVTETEVYIVADVSYSSNRNLDQIDEYIESVRDSLPENSKIGVVCFGKDTQLLTKMGGKLKSVKEADVDSSETDIASALEYAAGLFSKNTVKRLILITDGKQNSVRQTEDVIAAVDMIYAKDIYLDAIYLNNNIAADDREVQISGVDVTESVYLNHATTANVLVQSNQATQATLYLYRKSVEAALADGEAASEPLEVAKQAVNLTRGYNVVSIALDTSVSDTYDYEAYVEVTDPAQDSSPYNNRYTFTQRVSDRLSVLLVTSNEADVEKVQQMYGERADISSYVTVEGKLTTVPCTVEELCRFDEIVLSDVDVRNLRNATAFVLAVDKVVSVFGKSLVTLGDLCIQNKDDAVLAQLEDMLPVQFGNNENDPKLYGIVIDTSRSMQLSYKLILAKQVATQLLNMIRDEDYVTVIFFSGDARIVQPPTPASNREEIVKLIQGIEPTQGTRIDAALSAALETMQSLPYNDKQVMLLSDGKNHLASEDTADIAAEMAANGITVSVIDTVAPEEGQNTLKSVAEAGRGNYYRLERVEELTDIMFADIADDLTESVIRQKTEVEIQTTRDDVMDGVVTLPDVHGYLYAKPKARATTVLSVDYQRSSGVKVEVPLYAYRSYGEGRVTTFTSSITGDWAQEWTTGNTERFWQNVLTVNTPKECRDVPYTYAIEQVEDRLAEIVITPATVNPDTVVSVTLTPENGEPLTQELVFNSKDYRYTFDITNVGKYTLDIEYIYDGVTYSAQTYFHLPFTSEYDSFALFDASALYAAIRNRGNVSEDGKLTLDHKEEDIETYTVDYTIPLLIAAAALYVIDVVIRKLKWRDIRSLFKRSA